MGVGATHVVKNAPVRSREQSTAADGTPHQTPSSRRRYRLFQKSLYYILNYRQRFVSLNSETSRFCLSHLCCELHMCSKTTFQLSTDWTMFTASCLKQPIKTFDHRRVVWRRSAGCFCVFVEHICKLVQEQFRNIKSQILHLNRRV